ncbi:dihydrofolate reductase [Pedobacter insulae]|uniref:Dihydrofolate reductase n=1 Tax=Pedobacter insulae TaxID=414048 RepID=A0A1I2UJY7_9SPHI|nr:dihydrofolate reductase [Pedobacter insulae]SFG75156.1 dihydrofolate reductase [Pedobacter insulae]
MNKLSIIVAVSENNAIGKDNQLLWHLPADLKHFKEITSGNTIIMGRKTYDSIGKPLPNRRNIVITRNANLVIPGVEVATSLVNAIELCKHDKEVFIIGGAEIYQQSLAHATHIYLTRVHRKYEADTFFPAIDSTEWKELNSITHGADEKNEVAYTFSTMERI